jgi:t-SNARE complex subunit (syntaxin)
MNEERKKRVMGKINEIKSNIETFISDVNVNDLKTSFNLMIKDAQKDFNKLMEKDLENLKKKLHNEKSDFESKAKKFLDGHKKELTNLQAKIDKLLKSTTKLKISKSTNQTKPTKAAPASKKKVIKKVQKSVIKPGFKTKTTKKSSAK